MPILLFDEEQYEHLDAFLEYFPTVPELHKCGTFIIRPAREGIIEYPGIKEKIDAVKVTRVLSQKLRTIGRCIVPFSKDMRKSHWTAKDFLKIGSCNGEDPSEQIIEFHREIKKRDMEADYGSDLSDVTLSKGHERLDLPKLAQNSCLKYDPKFIDGQILKGIHEGFLYLGRKSTTAGIHREDVDMGSLKLMHWAEDKAEKMWFATGVEDCINVQMRMTDLAHNVMDNGPKSFHGGNLCCGNFFRRKGLFVPLEEFERWMTEDYFDGSEVNPTVPVYLGRQRPLDLVVTLPRSWHQVYNTGKHFFVT